MREIKFMSIFKSLFFALLTSTILSISACGGSGGLGKDAAIPEVTDNTGNDTDNSDIEPPTTPNNLSAEALSSDQIEISWTPSNDNVGVDSYTILRNGVNLASSITNNFIDTNLNPATTYNYRVVAYDAAGNASQQSDNVSEATQIPEDNEVPSRPSNLAVDVQSSTQIQLSWELSSDNVAVSGYAIFRNDENIASSSLNSFTDTELSPNTTYQYEIVAYDPSGNTSLPSTNVIGTTPVAQDNDAPSTPEDLAVTSQSPTQIQIQLSWSTSSDNISVSYYSILRDDESADSSDSANVIDADLNPDVSYQAYDAAGGYWYRWQCPNA